MCAAAAPGVCACNGREPNKTIAIVTTIQAVESPGPSLKSLIVTFPLVRSGFRPSQPPSHFDAWAGRYMDRRNRPSWGFDCGRVKWQRSKERELADHA